MLENASIKSQIVNFNKLLLFISDMGFSNLDLGLYQFVVSMLVNIYPAFVDYALLLEMPWIFNATWKVLKVCKF